MRETYTPLQRTLHWLTVLALIVQYALGWLMPHLRRGVVPSELNNLHMSFGFVVLAILATRLFVRLKDGAPADEPSLPQWQRLAAHTVHWALYALLVAFIVTGWIFTSVRGWQLTFFGLFPIPAIAPKDWELGHTIGEIHHQLAWPFVGIVVLHISAALWHHFIRRDGVLKRMLPQA